MYLAVEESWADAEMTNQKCGKISGIFYPQQNYTPPPRSEICPSGLFPCTSS